MTARYVIFATYALVAVSMWSPGGVDPSSSGVWELLRYTLFGALSASIVLATVLGGGFAFSRAPEWVFLSAFLLYTSLSALWSEGGVNAVIKGGLIFSALLVAICLASVIGLRGLLRIFYNAMSVFVLLSLLVVIFWPERGIETGWMLEGDWRGIAGQKNGLGAIASLVFVASLALPVARHPDMRPTILGWCVRLFVLAISALCLVNSGSRGALVIAIIGLTLVAISRLPRPAQRVGMISAVLLAIPVVALVAATLDIRADEIDVLGLSIDSNSRITIWLYGLTQLDGRQFLGFGVDGFWTPERVSAFRVVHGWVLDNFHNGYITILVEGGLIGLGLALLAIGFLLLLYLVAIGNMRDGYLSVAFAYAGMFLVGNLTENELGRSTALSFIMFLSLSFSVRGRVEHVLAERSAARERREAGIGAPSAEPTLS